MEWPSGHGGSGGVGGLVIRVGQLLYPPGPLGAEKWAGCLTAQSSVLSTIGVAPTPGSVVLTLVSAGFLGVSWQGAFFLGGRLRGGFHNLLSSTPIGTHRWEF